jgi:hypothetical protein
MDHSITRQAEMEKFGRSISNVRAYAGEGFEIIRYDIVDATGKPIRTVQEGWSGGKVLTGHVKSLDMTKPENKDPSYYQKKEDFFPNSIKKTNK